MKYKDIKFNKHQDRQRYDDLDDSIRKNNRHILRKFTKLYNTYLINYINKDWWNCLSFNDKEVIYFEYINTSSFFNEKNNDLWSNHTIYYSIESFVNHVNKDFKPDIIKLRNCKFKSIGI